MNSRHSLAGPCRTISTLVLVLTTLVAAGTSAHSVQQERTERILEQDPSLNNLVDPPGYETVPLGDLGAVNTTGEGDGAMILVAGFGFGGGVFEGLLEDWDHERRVYAVTLAGFGGTQAPPAPSADTSFGEQTWTLGAVAGVEDLMRRESLRDVVLVGHWLGGTQVALELARRHPEQVSGVILLAGSARWVAATPNPQAPDDLPLERRVANVDEGMAPNWFKTVTRETWDDNNFLPDAYASNPVIGLRLWRQAADPPLHVWVRYLCEFFAQDSTLRLDEIDAPLLLVKPGMEGVYYEGEDSFLDAYLHRSWGDSLEGLPNAKVVTLPNTRIILWADDPGAVREAMEEFLQQVD